MAGLIGLWWAAGLGAQAREWTNDQGQTIEAEYLSSDGTSVVLDFRGRQVTYQLDRLSAADREFVAAQRKKEAERPAARTGWIRDFPISETAFPTTEGYLESRTAEAIYQAFDSGDFPSSWNVNKGDATAEFAYKDGKTLVYVPASYTGAEPYGVYVHISSGSRGQDLPEYTPVMDRLRMIYVSPKGTSNKEPLLRRVRLAVDALASVKAEWKTDPERTVVGGISGGGHMAMVTHAMFPQMFVASVSHAAQSTLPGVTSSGHFPGLSARDLKSRDLKGHKWCVISGNKDFNYPRILETSQRWKEGRFDYEFFDVPGMGHTNAPPEELEKALKWCGM